ncbi:MAG TPA: ABC transporter ATP-binding protein [Ramlibacter sp.]|nr:ABC transporter ATP-binding protein [Ramlibacter sp.]
MLDIQKLNAAYHQAEVLRGVSLQVGEGEMVALIGPNGAGKSTLLNAISGFVPKRSGSICFDGQELIGVPPHQVSCRGLLQVPEGRLIISDLTTLDNLLLGQSACGTRAPRFTVDDVFRLFPILKERAGQMAGTMSGGQQQMLAIGRALLGSPRLLLLDEPSLGLAPAIVKQMFRALRTLNSEGLTVLLVEQNARLALDITDRAYVLERGAIVHEGQSRDLKTDPHIARLYLGQHKQNAGSPAVPAV